MKVARFGKNVVWKADWAEGEFDLMQQRLAASHDDVVRRIDESVGVIVELVAGLPPLKMLHRAWWERSAATLGIDNEFDVKSEHVHASRMLDFVQSVVAAVVPAGDVKAELPDEEWMKLQIEVEKLFDTCWLVQVRGPDVLTTRPEVQRQPSIGHATCVAPATQHVEWLPATTGGEIRFSEMEKRRGKTLLGA